MVFERIRLFWAKCKLVRLIVFLAFVVGVLSFLLLIGSNYYTELSEATKGIVGTLLGAITGGCFTLLGSLVINKRAMKASNAIRKKNTIYKPLYDELMEIHSVILVENPYPALVLFEKGPQTELRHPQYTVWGRIKSDSRYLEVPAKLRKTMEDLYSAVEKYVKARTRAINSLSTIYNEEISKLPTKPRTNWHSAGECFLSVLIGGSDSNEEFVTHVIDANSSDQIDTTSKKLKEIGSADPDYKLFLDAKETWNDKENNVLNLLAFYIQYSTEKYEG